MLRKYRKLLYKWARPAWSGPGPSPRQAAPGNQNALEVDFTRLGSIELGTHGTLSL